MIIENFNSTIDLWINELRQYTFVQLCSKPSPASWSLGQLTNHLINDTNFYIEQIKICVTSNEHSSEQSSPEAKEMFRNNEFPNVALEGSPENAFIKQPDSKDHLINDLRNLKIEMNNLAETIVKTQFKGKTKHPGLNYFSAIEWLQFADMHFRHHLRQMRRIDDFLKQDKESVADISGLDEYFEMIYDSFNRRNIDAVINNMTPDVKWANGMDGGFVYGHDGVREYWTRQFKLVSSNVTPIEVKEEEGVYRIKVRQVVHDLRGKRLADEIVVHVFKLRENKIEKFEIELE